MEPEARLPTHVEVSGLVRLVQQAGGFATVIAKGEADAGTILLLLADRGAPQQAYERLPSPDGDRRWTLSRTEDRADPGAFSAWLERRQAQDPDLWIVELDVPQAERFIL